MIDDTFIDFAEITGVVALSDSPWTKHLKLKTWLARGERIVQYARLIAMSVVVLERNGSEDSNAARTSRREGYLDMFRRDRGGADPDENIFVVFEVMCAETSLYRCMRNNCAHTVNTHIVFPDVVGMIIRVCDSTIEGDVFKDIAHGYTRYGGDASRKKDRAKMIKGREGNRLSKSLNNETLRSRKDLLKSFLIHYRMCPNEVPALAPPEQS